jgi:hypothetical protein
MGLATNLGRIFARNLMGSFASRACVVASSSCSVRTVAGVFARF